VYPAAEGTAYGRANAGARGGGGGDSRSDPTHSDEDCSVAERTTGGALHALVRRNFEMAIAEFSVEGDMAQAWLDKTMVGIQTLVTEIEAGGGAAGGKA